MHALNLAMFDAKMLANLATESCTCGLVCREAAGTYFVADAEQMVVPR